MKKIIIVILLFLSFSVFAQKKPIVTVLDFKIDGVTTSEMRSIISFLSSALFKTGKFIIIDVQERETLLKELEFSVSDCSDEACMLEIGRLLSAEYIVTGNIGKVGSRYLLAIKMLETSTGRTRNSVEGVYYSIDEIVDDLYNLAAGLADIDAGEFVTEDETKEETVIKDETKENTKDEIETDDQEDDNIILAEDSTTDFDTVSPDSIDTATEPDTGKEETRKDDPVHFAIGFGAGATFPLGTLNTMLESTFTPFTYVDYIFPHNWGSIGIGLFFGYQAEKTTSEYPDDDYELISFPLAIHSRFTINIKPLFISIDVASGAAVNNVNYEEDAITDDLVTSKFFLSAGPGLGILFGSRFRLFFYNNFFIISFNKNAYTAYSAGLACELNF